VGKHLIGLAALVGDQFVDSDTAAQGSGDDTARARPHDYVDVVDRAGQEFLHRWQRARYPGRAEHAPSAKDKRCPRSGPPGNR
jgi:hypothetical protein